MNLEFVKEMLNDYNVNISEVSKKTGISKVSLYNIKKGKQIPSERNFIKIRKYFSDRNILDTYTELEKVAKNLQEEINKTGKNITLVVSNTTIGQLENFKIF